VASHQLIDDQLAALASRLPVHTVEELADGLAQTWEHHLATGLPAGDAARAAIAEFGSVDEIVQAFVRAAPGRRLAWLLLATGPAMAACWGGSLVAGHAWTWPVPLAVGAGFGAALLVAVAVLVIAATSRRDYRRTRLGALGGLGVVALDAGMLAAVLLVAPTLAWPMVLAIPASLARIGLTLRLVPRAFAG
jgi:hypothetical protein